MHLAWETMIDNTNSSLFFIHISIMVSDRNEINSVVELESITVCGVTDK